MQRELMESISKGSAGKGSAGQGQEQGQEQEQKAQRSSWRLCYQHPVVEGWEVNLPLLRVLQGQHAQSAVRQAHTDTQGTSRSSLTMLLYSRHGTHGDTAALSPFLSSCLVPPSPWPCLERPRIEPRSLLQSWLNPGPEVRNIPCRSHKTGQLLLDRLWTKLG